MSTYLHIYLNVATYVRMCQSCRRAISRLCGKQQGEMRGTVAVSAELTDDREFYIAMIAFCKIINQTKWLWWNTKK